MREKSELGLNIENIKHKHKHRKHETFGKDQ